MDEILTILNSMEGASFDRINNVPVFNRATGGYQRLNKHQPKGMADIIGVYYGKYIAIEVKTRPEYNWLMNFTAKIDDLAAYQCKNKKESHAIDQVLYLKEKRKNGAIAFFTYSIEDTLKKLEGI